MNEPGRDRDEHAQAGEQQGTADSSLKEDRPPLEVETGQDHSLPTLELADDRRQLIDHTVSQVLDGPPGPKRCAMVSRSAEETFELARSLAERLQTGAVFLLRGDLGAGKTVFTKGIAAGLGIDPAEITSPTFTLINVHHGRLPLYHVDLYRLDRASTSHIGLEEILEDKNGVSVIEWAERLDYPTPAALSVDFEYITDSERKVTLVNTLRTS